MIRRVSGLSGATGASQTNPKSSQMLINLLAVSTKTATFGGSQKGNKGNPVCSSSKLPNCSGYTQLEQKCDKWIARCLKEPSGWLRRTRHLLVLWILTLHFSRVNGKPKTTKPAGSKLHQLKS